MLWHSAFMELIAVHTTLPTADQARAMARTLIQRRLAACVQMEAVESLYTWQGAVQQENEVRLVCKSLRARAEALTRAIRELHPYEVPELLVFDIASAEPAYVQWVAQMCAGVEGT